MLEATGAAFGTSSQRPGPGRLGFAGQGAGATAVASVVFTQTLLVVANWPDLSFWGFAIYLSVLVAAIAAGTGLFAGILAWVVGARLLPSRARALLIGVTHTAAALAAQLAYALTLSETLPDHPLIWLAIVVPAVLGGGVAGVAVWRRRPEGPFEENQRRRAEAWLARSRA